MSLVVIRPVLQSYVPSAIAISTVTAVQVSPESLEIKMGPFATAATSLVPSADDATDCQSRLDSFADQLAPESLVIHICPPRSSATSLVPSAEEAKETQVPPGPQVGSTTPGWFANSS